MSDIFVNSLALNWQVRNKYCIRRSYIFRFLRPAYFLVTMNKKAIELSLELFGAVPAGPPKPTVFKKTLPYGVVLDETAAYAMKTVLRYFKANQLNAEQLNATFHKSWKVIRDSSREELFIHQILHYFTTYGTNFTSDYVYYPAEELELPELKKLRIRVIKGLPASELIDKCLKMLSSGMALAEETIEALLNLLEELKHTFTSVDHIRNKEAAVRIIAKSGVYPSHPSEFLRFLIYQATDSTLLIKSKETIEAIKNKKLNVAKHLDAYGLERCAEVFRRFKPLWLAFKSNKSNIKRINEIGRLARRHHKPLPVDVLNTVTSIVYSPEQIKEALSSVNNFRKSRLLNSLNTRLNQADAFLYRIRNGKSYSKAKPDQKHLAYYRKVFNIVYADLVDCLKVQGKKIRYPEDIDYALPSTEKMFVGNFPAGTRITARNLVSGVYWEDAWGANDLDLSALSLEGKVGWDAAYKGQGLLYSGDMTEAPNGATELLYTNGYLGHPALAINNIFSGKEGCKFKIIVGSAPKVEANYMFDPNELILEAECNMVGRQQILGIFLPEMDGRLSFVLVNAGFGSMSVSGNTPHSDLARKALFYQFSRPISFRQLMLDAGAEIVTEGDSDNDLRPEGLQKDTFIELLR